MFDRDAHNPLMTRPTGPHRCISNDFYRREGRHVGKREAAANLAQQSARHIPTCLITSDGEIKHGMD